MRLAVIPAAGRSSRLGRPKALLPYRGSCVVLTLAAALIEGGAERLFVVIAPGDNALADVCLGSGIEAVVNLHPEAGMLGSVRCGVQAADPEAGDALLVSPVDFPTVLPETVARLYATVEAPGGADTAVPTYSGRRGHPLAIRGPAASAIHGLDPAIGLRQLLERRPPLEVAVDDRGILADLDSWIDYAKLA